MKFAHLADCHIGGWSDLRLKELGMEVFSKAIEECIERNVEFVLIAGDLFNSALPSIDLIKKVALDLRKLKENGIRCYVIAGSHDYSPSGKTMLDVLENAGLVVNVAKFEENEKIKLFFVEDKSGIKITGLFGKAGGLERGYYKRLDREYLEREEGNKIFMFHTTLTEFKPDYMEMVSSEPVAILPKGFDYYAGGHPHYVFNEEKENYGRIAYPGALFPNNFFELEKFGSGGFWVNEFKDGKIESEFVEVKLKDVVKYKIDLDGKDSSQVLEYIMNKIDKNEIIGKIVLIRLVGTLSSGKISDIDFNKLNEELKNAFVVLRNSSGLKVREVEELNVGRGSVEEIENNLIKESNLDGDLVKGLLEVLSDEKQEGEKNLDFEERVVRNALKVLDLENDN